MNSGKRKAEKGKEELLGKPKKAGVSSAAFKDGVEDPREGPVWRLGKWT